MTESPESEPVRWLDDPSAGAALRADLVHTVNANAAGVDYAASLVALRSAIAAQTGALAPAAAAGKSLGFKTIVGGLALGAIGGLWAVQSDGVTTTRTEPAAVIEPASPPVIEPAAPPAAPVVTPPARVEPPRVEPSQAEPAVVVVEDPSPEPDKIERKPKVVESADDKYLREAELVGRARKHLESDPASTLQLTRKHEREFPRGALVEERAALAIRALAKLGRLDEARTQADTFLGDFGDGPHAAAVRRAIANDAAP